MATYDTDKLVKLEGLKALAEKVNNNFVKNDDFNEVSDKVGTLETDVTELQTQVVDLETASADYIKTKDVENNYLKKSDAEKTYLEQEDAEETYLTQTDASNTYLKQEDAQTTYATKADISSVYKPGGSKSSVNALANPSSDMLGYVYNMTAEFTADSKFVDDEVNNKYPAGTNVVVVDVGDETYKYDALAGFVDLTDYATTENVRTIVDDKLDRYYDINAIDDMIATNEDVQNMLDDIFGSNE